MSGLLGDVSALEARPTAGELRAYARAVGLPWYRGAAAVTVLTAVGLAVLVVLTAWALRAAETADYPSAARFLVAVVPLAYAVFAVFGLQRWLKWRGRDVRLWRFATAGGHGFADTVRSVGTHGKTVPDREGLARHPRDTLRGVVMAGPVTVARSTPAEGVARGRDGMRRPHAFASMTLPSATPHAVLRNPRSRLVPLAGVGLGARGEIGPGRGFTLQCARADEAAARRFFTPDLLSAIVALSAQCEAETAGGEFIVYFRNDTPVWTPEAMGRVAAVLETVTERIVDANGQ